MQIQIKEILLEGRVLDHLKRNWGKYSAGAGAAGLGAVYAAGQGVLGVDAQDAVQDFGEHYSHELENNSIENSINSDRDAVLKTLSKPDNIIDYQKTLDNQKNIQPSTYMASIQHSMANGLKKLTNMEDSGEQLKFNIRNPLTSVEMAADRGMAYIRPHLPKGI